MRRSNYSYLQCPLPCKTPVELLTTCNPPRKTFLQTDPSLSPKKVFQQLLRPFRRGMHIRQVPTLVLGGIGDLFIIGPELAEDVGNIGPVIWARKGEKPSIGDAGAQQSGDM